jgi:hypothetical protein
MLSRRVALTPFFRWLLFLYLVRNLREDVFLYRYRLAIDSAAATAAARVSTPPVDPTLLFGFTDFQQKRPDAADKRITASVARDCLRCIAIPAKRLLLLSGFGQPSTHAGGRICAGQPAHLMPA